MVPVMSVGGVPQFEDLRDIDDTVDIAGRAAGDALFHARSALSVLAGLGWAGFDALDLVVQSWFCTDGAQYSAGAEYQHNQYLTGRNAVHFCRHLDECRQ